MEPQGLRCDMSDLEALYCFLNKPVDGDMVSLLVATTMSIISVPTAESTCGYLTPPPSPTDKAEQHVPSLTHFIHRLIHHSHVQTPTLMSSLVYLNKLKQVIPPNSMGIDTTHHRIFLGALILAAKFTNDSSPMNKHWAKYTDGLLALSEVNALERELISFIGWGNLTFSNKDLIKSLQYFLAPIRDSLRLKSNGAIQARYPTAVQAAQAETYEPAQQMASSSSMPSLQSSSSTSTIASYASMGTPTSSSTSISSNMNAIPRSGKEDNLNIQLKPLRLPSALKSSKGSLRLATSAPLVDLSNNILTY